MGRRGAGDGSRLIGKVLGTTERMESGDPLPRFSGVPLWILSPTWFLLVEEQETVVD